MFQYEGFRLYLRLELNLLPQQTTSRRQKRRGAMAVKQ